METILKDKTYTTQEYFEIEEGSEVRHEFINGQLFEMAGASTEHYLMVKQIERLLERLFEVKGFFVYRENMKIKVTGEEKFYYPDVFITREVNNQDNRYSKNEPELIVEVSSESTFRSDAVDKLIAYQKFATLKYYLIVDPETIEVLVYTKDNEGGWLSEAFHNKTDIVLLKKWEISLPLEAIYP
jgi:Uma2 family endonuclease